jgi:hypothetical protein
MLWQRPSKCIYMNNDIVLQTRARLTGWASLEVYTPGFLTMFFEKTHKLQLILPGQERWVFSWFAYEKLNRQRVAHSTKTSSKVMESGNLGPCLGAGSPSSWELWAFGWNEIFGFFVCLWHWGLNSGPHTHYTGTLTTWSNPPVH